MQIGLTWLLAGAFLLASFGLIVLALRPDLDLATAGLFYRDQAFVGATPQTRFFRQAAALLPFLIWAAAFVIYGASLIRARHANHKRLLFLTLSFALGPGLLVNGVFKPLFHRPRPMHVEVFGGEAPFRPFYRTDGACPKNCAFPSGEAAAAFWTMAPAFLAPPPFRVGAMALAMLFGWATGFLRMAFGAHFLSDVLFSFCLTGGLATILWLWIKPRSS